MLSRRDAGGPRRACAGSVLGAGPPPSPAA